MEHVWSLLLLGLLSGLIVYPETSTGDPSVAPGPPYWPPRTTQDLVSLLRGADPRCTVSGQTTSSAFKSLRQLLGLVPQMITSGNPTNWLYGALNTLLNASGPQGDLKHLLLWGISHNLSWGFVDLPLVTPPSGQSQFLGLSMKSDLPTFLKICSDSLFPALKNVCNSMYHSIGESLQSLCLVITTSPSQVGTQFCTMFFTSLSDLLRDPCNTTKTSKAVRSITVNCAYATWYNSSTVSPSDVSTCSESDGQQFISSVCGDQKLLQQLASQSANSWLLGYCSYYSNPDNMCHYVSWQGNVVSAFSVAYCWLYDQDQLTSFLCSNPDLLAQLKENVDNQWLDPSCPTAPPTNIVPTVQGLCNYDQWYLEVVNPSVVAFCAETDEDAFTQYVCSSPVILQKLLIDTFNSWVATLCQYVIPSPPTNECNYTLWYKMDNGTLQLLVDPTTVAHCSQVDENQFLLYVCTNPSLLSTLTKAIDNSWVLQFCIDHMCNYSTWNSSTPDPSAVDLCWHVDQENLTSYLCSHQKVLQNIGLNGTSNISCPGNTTSNYNCSYDRWNLSVVKPSILGYCAEEDTQNFQTYICGNSYFVSLLKNNSEMSWVLALCNISLYSNISNCTDTLLNLHLQSCPNCNRTELEKLFLSVCNNSNLVPVLAHLWNSSALLTQFIVWNLCNSSSWGVVTPSPFLLSYCWTYDNKTVSNFLCNNFQFYDKLLPDINILETPICDPSKTCRYSTWNLTNPQISLVKYCADWDTQAFMLYFCSNSTIVNFLSENLNLTWIKLSCLGSNTLNGCNYEDWIPDTKGWMGRVGFSTVYLCSKNDTLGFMMNVCNNLRILSAMSEGPALTWTLNICYKLSTSSVLTQMLIWDVCDYSQTMTFTPYMVEFCWSYDEQNFLNYLCSNLTFYALIISQPQNFWLKPTCTPLIPTSASGALNYSIVQCHNQYLNPTNLDISLITFCATYDQGMFLNAFCNATVFQQENGSCSWGNKLCSYHSWHGAYVHPVVVKACWASDQLNFMMGVCLDSSLFTQLSQYAANSWLTPVCGTQSENQLENVVNALCRYKDWGNVSFVPVSIVAFCSTYNHEIFRLDICDGQQEAICNNTIEQWRDQNHDCSYATWEIGSIDINKILTCWILEKENFTTHVCTQPNLLSKLSSDSRNSWVAYVCMIFSTWNQTDTCLSDNDKRQLQWNCSVDLSVVCPVNGLTLLSFLPIGICYLQNAGLNVSTPSITAMYTQAVDTTIVLLLLLEDMQILNLSNTSGIRTQILQTILNAISQETLQKKQKTELLQIFGNTLLLLVEEEQSPSGFWAIVEAFFNLTVSELKVCISSLQPKSAQKFMRILTQNLTSLQVFKVATFCYDYCFAHSWHSLDELQEVSDDYFSMIVSTLLLVQVPTESLLFCDVVPFLHYLEPDELLMLLPPLQDNMKVLEILSVYVGSLSTEQQDVLGFWLRRSTIFQNFTKMDDMFIQQVGNLLPLFSLDVFWQLSSQQVVNILPSLPADLSSPYQRIVATKVLQAPNITLQDVDLMGRCVCQADVLELKRYEQNINISSALRRNLFQCIRRGDLFPDSMMMEFLFGDLQSQNLGNFTLESVPSLSVMILSLGHHFLQGLRPEQLLPVFSDLASVTLTLAQARELVQKVLYPGNVSDEVLSHMGSLVLGISPALLHQLSENQLTKLMPALTSNADILTPAQTMAVFRTLWASWNISQKLNDLGPLLPSLPLVMLRAKSKEILSNLSNLSSMPRVKWNRQQALLLIRQVAQMIPVSDEVRSSVNSVTVTSCDSLRKLLQNNTIQVIEQFRNIISSLPHHVIRCALDTVITPSLTLLKSLSPQMIAEIQPSVVSLLPAKSCRYVLHILKSEPQFVADLPQQRRFGMLDALIRCLNSAGATSPRAQFILLGVLAPLLKGSAYLTLSQGMMLHNVERLTNYCYPQETKSPLSQLLQDSQGFGSSTLWKSQILERLDRLVPLLPITSLQSLKTAALSSQWLSQMLSKERIWRKSALGTTCRKSETADQQVEAMQKLRTLFQRLHLARSMPKSSVYSPACSMLRGSIVSAWGIEALLRMTSENFMDCLEEMGQDPDIPDSELAPLLNKVLEIAGPLSVLPNNVLMRLGRLATKIDVQQVKVVSLGDLQVMEAFGQQQEWTITQINTIASGFMKANNVTAKDLNAVHLVTLGYVICGLLEIDIKQIKPVEFCSAVMYLGQLALSCTELQFEALVRLCTGSDMFGPVSGWTEDIFREIGSVAAGLQDMELSSLVLEQIRGLTPLAISLIPPQKFAVSFSSQQLQLFSWSQAKAVTQQQSKLLDSEQMKALAFALIEDSGNQTYRAGKSQAGHCSYYPLLHVSALLPVLHVIYMVKPLLSSVP